MCIDSNTGHEHEVAAMAAAAAAFLGNPDAAPEVARGVATCVLLEPCRSVVTVARELLKHRRICYGLQIVGDELMCARAMSRAWHRASAEVAA